MNNRTELKNNTAIQKNISMNNSSETASTSSFQPRESQQSTNSIRARSIQGPRPLEDKPKVTDGWKLVTRKGRWSEGSDGRGRDITDQSGGTNSTSNVPCIATIDIDTPMQ